MENQNDIEKLVKEFKEIPPMPHVMVKALEVIRNPHTGMQELATIMCLDQAISTKTLALVNSAYYGFRQQITSIGKAVVLLGMMKAKNLIMSLAMKQMMSAQGSRELWEHSIKCALASEFLATQFKFINPDDAFVIGFLHDIGKILLNQKDPVKYSKVNYIASQNNQSLLELETTFFGGNHCELGALMAKNWQLPVVLVNCIKYHHAPNLSNLPAACGIVYIADRLVQTKMPEVILDPEIMEHLPMRISDPVGLREQLLANAAAFLKEIQ